MKLEVIFWRQEKLGEIIKPRPELNKQFTEIQLQRILKSQPVGVPLRFSKKVLKELGLPYEGGSLVRINGKVYTFMALTDYPSKSYLLGLGDYGRVKLLQNVKDPSDKKALKVLRNKDKPRVVSAFSPEYREFERELKILELLGRGSAEVIEKIGGKHKSFCGLLDLLPGVKLEDYIRNNPNAEIGKRLKIIIQCLKELMWMHSKGYAHNDVHPRNFVYDDETGLVKITDFGLTQRNDSANKFIAMDIRYFAGTILMPLIGESSKDSLKISYQFLPEEQQTFEGIYKTILSSRKMPSVITDEFVSKVVADLEMILKTYILRTAKDSEHKDSLSSTAKTSQTLSAQRPSHLEEKKPASNESDSTSLSKEKEKQEEVSSVLSPAATEVPPKAVVKKNGR